MMTALEFVWKYKVWVLLALVVIFAGIYISYIKISHNLMEAKLTRSEASLDVAVKSNEILVANAASVETQNKKMKEITVAADKLRRLVADIPIDVRKALNHESITRINDCVSMYGNDPNGVLPEGCGSIKASMPVAGAAK
jgi:hypothetical protein